jgi:exonuclease III
MKSNQINKLNIIQWNCNSMINKCDLLINFLNDFKPDIMMLNETKCTAEIANFNFDHPRYELMIKQRTKNPNHGGGVAIIIKKTLNFSESKEFNHLNEEFICVKLKINNSVCLIGTLYTPPNKELNKDLFNQIKLKYKQFLIGGDLNSKLIKFGCNSDNNSGHILDEIIETNNLFIKNNKQPTYFEYRANTVYSEILDLIILSNDLNMNNSEFKVHTDSILTNDVYFHCPVEINIHTNVEKIKKQMVNGYNYKAADWELFKNTLYVSNKIENNSSLSCEQINDIIS